MLRVASKALGTISNCMSVQAVHGCRQTVLIHCAQLLVHAQRNHWSGVLVVCMPPCMASVCCAQLQHGEAFSPKSDLFSIAYEYVCLPEVIAAIHSQHLTAKLMQHSQHWNLQTHTLPCM